MGHIREDPVLDPLAVLHLDNRLCIAQSLFIIFKVGLYQECVEAYEVVLGDGSLVTATKDNENSDLYHCLPWSHGTLGKSLLSKIGINFRTRTMPTMVI